MYTRLMYIVQVKIREMILRVYSHPRAKSSSRGNCSYYRILERRKIYLCMNSQLKFEQSLFLFALYTNVYLTVQKRIAIVNYVLHIVGSNLD